MPPTCTIWAARVYISLTQTLARYFGIQFGASSTMFSAVHLSCIAMTNLRLSIHLSSASIRRNTCARDRNAVYLNIRLESSLLSDAPRSRSEGPGWGARALENLAPGSVTNVRPYQGDIKQARGEILPKFPRAHPPAMTDSLFGRTKYGDGVYYSFVHFAKVTTMRVSAERLTGGMIIKHIRERRGTSAHQREASS